MSSPISESSTRQEKGRHHKMIKKLQHIIGATSEVAWRVGKPAYKQMRRALVRGRETVLSVMTAYHVEGSGELLPLRVIDPRADLRRSTRRTSR